MASDLTRERVQELRSTVRFKRPDLVRKQMRKLLEEEGVSGTVRRGSKTYNAIDYILDDLDSYGPVPG